MKLKILLPLYIGAIIGPMGGFGIVAILPAMAGLWDVAFGRISIAITYYMVPFIVIQIFSGAIAQIFDTRKTLLFGFGLYAAGSVCAGLAGSFSLFLVFRVVQGVGAGFLAPIVMALIGELVHERHLGRAIGLLGVAYTAGITLGPYISGMIEVRLGWPWFFFFLTALSLSSGIFYFFTSRASGRASRKQESAGQGSLLDVFPVLKKASREPGVAPISFSAFCLFFGYIGIMTFTADVLKTQFGLPSDKVGAILSITGLSGIVVSPIAGALGDRVGRKAVFLSGCLIAMLAISLMAWIPYSFYSRLMLFLLLGTGSATAWTSLNTLAVNISPSLRQPVTSLYNAIKFSGYASAPMALPLIYSAFGILGVQIACITAVVIAMVLALKAT
ncbi:MFS transporter [Desulfosarcina sp. OttesenSCG-928-A07]|nr:MFS transporter [Desulfosarcina sp. OttesenSCG-928-G17]MDL2330112.1 MFS transporter [Desulfosarcina sp. OttesenSCG-928-A07]